MEETKSHQLCQREFKQKQPWTWTLWTDTIQSHDNGSEPDLSEKMPPLPTPVKPNGETWSVYFKIFSGLTECKEWFDQLSEVNCENNNTQ
jgi:hypothetical protein